MSESEYLVLSGSKFIKPLIPQFKELGGRWTGFCWIFPSKSTNSLESIISELPSYGINRLPLPKDHTFDSYVQAFSAQRYKKDLRKLESDIIKATSLPSLANFSLESIMEMEIDDEAKNQIAELWQRRELLKESIAHAEGMEKALSSYSHIPPIVPIGNRIKSHNEILKLYRGKKYLGLRVKTIEEFNEKLKGLRKLILIAAAPNVGKTALTVQLAQEVLSIEEDACLIYISLEMTSEEIFTRMNLCLSGLDFDTYVLGREQIENENGRQPLFSHEELRKIEESTKHIEKIGDRLQIIDLETWPTLNSEAVINYIEQLKTHTKCSRVIVIIDYLQVWPIPQGLRFSSDIEADKWRIGEIKKIRNAVNKINQDPVIVISEARKPSSNDDAWGSDLSDVMGSARGTYTPDAVLLLSALQPAQLKKLWEQMKMPSITYREDGNEPEDTKDPSNIRGFLASHGIAICNIKMPKARDGMKKFNTLLAFHFYKNKFTQINWLDIRLLATNFNKPQNK